MRAALLQMTGGIDPERNAAALKTAAREARAQGADILFTPEMSGLLDRDRARASAHLFAEEEDRVLATVREAAAKEKLWVHLGSLALRAEPGSERLVNRGFLIDADGGIVARYDKMHLFDVDLPGGESWRESAVYDAGGAAVVARTPWGMLGLSICYDLRFPDLYRALSNAGATMLSIPAAFTVPTGKAHWHILQRARAIEAGAYVFAAAHRGSHDDGRETFGHSLVVDPWGEVLLDMGDGAGVGFTDVDLARIGQVRGRIPTLAHRRPVPEPVIAR